MESAIGTNNGEIFRHDDSINGFGHLIFPVVHEIKFHLNFRFETATDGTNANADASNTNPHAPVYNAANTYLLSIDAAKYAANVAEVNGGVLNAGITNGKLGHHFSFTSKICGQIATWVMKSTLTTKLVWEPLDRKLSSTESM